MQELHRCRWVNLANPAYVRYHDLEWGRPHYDDTYLFELLLLESFQAGLSWECILNKREAFRRAFDGFDPQKIAAYDAEKCAALMQDAGIVRNRLKIAAAVNNAKIFLAIQAEWGSFSNISGILPAAMSCATTAAFPARPLPCPTPFPPTSAPAA